MEVEIKSFCSDKNSGVDDITIYYCGSDYDEDALLETFEESYKIQLWDNNANDLEEINLEVGTEIFNESDKRWSYLRIAMPPRLIEKLDRQSKSGSFLENLERTRRPDTTYLTNYGLKHIDPDKLKKTGESITLKLWKTIFELWKSKGMSTILN